MEAKPLVVIVGPTASGKTSLAVTLAERFGGEIICADSRTVYKDMNIGTAKPSLEDQRRVPHWGIDLVSPGERFMAADFKTYAQEKITEIRKRGHIPFLVGGSGLYIDSVIFDYQFGPQANNDMRASLEKLSLQELHDYCNKNNILLPENYQNKRYVIRAIEQRSINNQRSEFPIDSCIIVGIATEKDVLKARIAERSEQLFQNGVVEEAITLGKKYGWDSESMTGNIYPLVHSYLEGERSLSEIKDRFTTLDWQLAKRQLTWLRRNKFVKWFTLTEAKSHLESVLAPE